MNPHSLLLCFCMFAAVIYASILESQAPVRLGLLNTYKSLFSLGDSLADVKTSNDLMEYLRMVSEQARLIQPVSSAYFVEEAGEVKILSGLRRFDKPEILESPQVQPRVDSPSWSLMAWVQLKENGGATVLRKPLGKTPDEAKLSCWSWYVHTHPPLLSSSFTSTYPSSRLIYVRAVNCLPEASCM